MEGGGLVSGAVGATGCQPWLNPGSPNLWDLTFSDQTGFHLHSVKPNCFPGLAPETFPGTYLVPSTLETLSGVRTARPTRAGRRH